MVIHRGRRTLEEPISSTVQEGMSSKGVRGQGRKVREVIRGPVRQGPSLRMTTNR